MGIALIICMTNRPFSIYKRETSIMPARFPIYRSDNCSTNCDGQENVVTREKLLGMLVVLLLITLAVVLTSF